ncbi:3-hydroxyisobutyrate dehydrogenase-like beta-hydroxyacid dehydrogenase [Roseiarcus fermentans]|uniref:3-hydroxyisobutyrate dehydrogenase-like beta-hydroxyacid dehydrogenase n=1 Tax=Roseiarcus fermentans TaxID=1473586 RepID=A0A366ELU8_9HYPH|nr:NAD(P)-dependent oxidoreductase [Roseiarcus fermentans]RBP03264.1 3-hydroxyisobutyrate dehydrogenase-like beta-hydroxyacid dehydrogenase [Roseiarcus fermentans]
MKLTLELMLFGLAAILRREAKRPDVAAMLRDRRRVVQIKTRDDKVARSFVFAGGAVFSRRGALPTAEVSFVWRDAETAVRRLRSADPEAVANALADQSLTIVGDGDVAGWFGDLARIARRGAKGAKDLSAAKPAVAVIGLGRMGSGIALSLLRAGFPLTVYNRTAEKTRPLVAAGAKAAETPAAAAASAKFVITSLMGDASVLAVVEGPQGLLAGLGRSSVHIGASTISAGATRRLVALHAERGCAYLAAPVVGRPDAAAAGDLMGLVSGDRSVFDASRDVISAYTRQTQYLGEDPATALAAKLAINYTAATLIDLMGQVYAFGEKTGIPLAALHTMFRMLWAQPGMQGYATRIWRRDFEDLGFDVRGGLKDATLILEAAQAAHVRWDFVETTQRKLARALEMGLGEKDWSVVYEVTRAEAGLAA